MGGVRSLGLILFGRDDLSEEDPKEGEETSLSLTIGPFEPNFSMSSVPIVSDVSWSLETSRIAVNDLSGRNWLQRGSVEGGLFHSVGWNYGTHLSEMEHDWQIKSSWLKFWYRGLGAQFENN